VVGEAPASELRSTSRFAAIGTKKRRPVGPPFRLVLASAAYWAGQA